MITHWDFSILHWIADHLQTAFLDPVMIFFTFLGEVGIVWILLGVLLLYRPRFRRAGAAILIALLLSLLLCNILLKNAVHRPRPFQLEEVTLLISPPGEFSFHLVMPVLLLRRLLLCFACIKRKELRRCALQRLLHFHGCISLYIFPAMCYAAPSLELSAACFPVVCSAVFFCGFASSKMK